MRVVLFLLGTVVAWALIWLPLIPNATGRVSVDFSLWLPDLLAGFYWHLREGWLAVPWFSPAQCGGLPFQADPQIGALSVPQFLAFVVPPLRAVQLTSLLFTAAGFAGAYALAGRFRLSAPARLLVASLFALNAFFGVRMAVGHLTYAPFMLLPALACCLFPQPARPVSNAGTAGAVGAGALVVAVMLEAGMVHILPPVFLSLAILLAMHGLRFAPSARPLKVLGAATALGLAIAAGKLAASLAFLAHFPREDYPLPGIANPITLIGVATQSLFGQPDHASTHAIVHSRLVQERHEFEYGVSLVPALLMLAALPTLRGPRPVPRATLLLLAGLIGLCALPLALNWYWAPWNALLKALPFFGSSSNLVRWFAAWILPAVLGGGLALDRMAARRPRLAVPLALAGIAGMVGTQALADHRYYGPTKLGFYDARPIDAAWHRAAARGEPPPVIGLAIWRDAKNELSMAPERQNALTQGASQFFCYAPLFGYRLERFPFGRLHPGSALDEAGGDLNFKNPACYVFPAANGCMPGDPFRIDQHAALEAFLDYRAFPFAKPWWARLADACGMAAALAALGLVAAGGRAALRR